MRNTTVGTFEMELYYVYSLSIWSRVTLNSMISTHPPPRKSSYLENVLKFKKTSPFSKNWFIEGRFFNESTAPLATILVSKRFQSERIKEIMDIIHFRYKLPRVCKEGEAICRWFSHFFRIDTNSRPTVNSELLSLCPKKWGKNLLPFPCPYPWLRYWQLESSNQMSVLWCQIWSQMDNWQGNCQLYCPSEQGKV